jgi:hypothetical protein
LNKALALSALLLLAFSVIRKSSAKRNPNGPNLYMAGVFASMHVVLSLTLLSPAYYESMFVQNKLTAAAGVSMALGAVAAAAMTAGKGMQGASDPDGGVRNLAILAFVVGLHAALQGFAGWFTPAKWPGMMPPITLISFLLGLAAVTIVFWPKRRG